MKCRATGVVFLLSAVVGLHTLPQASAPLERDPAEVVRGLWDMAARGELLSEKGWTEASYLFTKPNPFPRTGVIQIFSDYFGVNAVSVDGKTATVDMECANLGDIDAALRFKSASPLPPNVMKASLRYRLALVPDYILEYGLDGRTLLRKREIPGKFHWEIEDPLLTPWVTVNSAIRYVLEARNRTSDPLIKKNADETLRQLLRLH